LSGLLGGGILCLVLSAPAAAQVETQKTETLGETTRTVEVQRGEIVYVNGNTVVVKMEDGELKHFNNVPDSATIMVDGQHLNVHQLKAGMKVEKQTITSSTPRVITTVETVTGRVFHVQAPNSVILTLDNGENQRFKIPQGQKFTIDGQETDAFGLKKGMKVSAQRVTEVPETVVAQEVKRTGKMPPPPPPPNADVPILVVLAAPAAAPAAPVETAAAAEPAPKKLPKTASDLPFVGILGAFLCAISLIGRAIRRSTLPA
jgi:RNase P/RNase MRP subunit p29